MLGLLSFYVVLDCKIAPAVKELINPFSLELYKRNKPPSGPTQQGVNKPNFKKIQHLSMLHSIPQPKRAPSSDKVLLRLSYSGKSPGDLAKMGQKALSGCLRLLF